MKSLLDKYGNLNIEDIVVNQPSFKRIIEDGIITKIEALPCNETPKYYKRAQKAIFPQYIGKTVSQALKIKPDAATGATYSSKALISNIKIGLNNYKKSAKKK